ncbi:MAG TPA: EamA family transporter [Caldisericia bacterium]|nr:EamA family transporter [Caldisericia bacterium]HON83460.1 EamA family transporter [Caldisericia bacterium]HPC57001.1 EamA family transporter [Caldisericia bacterium]HPP43873.1 EamA family transporter [Caldisericia bacterium]HRT37421.1 EamA family transporter [Caldisericia bacterium]
MFSYFALLGRILLIGIEKIAIKELAEEDNNLIVTFLFFFLALFFFLPFVIFSKKPNDFSFLKTTIITSLIYTNSFILYVKSISISEVSLVAPLYNINVFFLIILTSIFLDEKITILKIIGLILLIYGSSFLNRQENLFLSIKALFKDKGSKIMILSSLLIAIGRTIDGQVTKTGVSPLFYSFFLYLFITIILFFIILLTKKSKGVNLLLRKKPLLSILAGMVNAYSYLFLLIAFKNIDVSLAEPSTMLGTIITLILSKYIFKEDIKYRLIGVLIMILGTCLIFLKI